MCRYVVECQNYGVHGERVRQACWGFLCSGGARELRGRGLKSSTS